MAPGRSVSARLSGLAAPEGRERDERVERDASSFGERQVASHVIRAGFGSRRFVQDQAEGPRGLF
jgi:hypothetical protein